MTQAIAKTHAVLWVDHHQATVLWLDVHPAPARHLKAHSHPTGQHGSEVRAQHEFFGELCDSLHSVDAVLATGSKTALIDLRHYVDKHRAHLAPKIVAYDIVDHLTDNQLAAHGRQYFEL